jgi:hypothetical protein
MAKVVLFCQDERVSPWKSKSGVEYKPLCLLLHDDAADNPLRELWEMRLRDEVKDAWTGKCKGRHVLISVHTVSKINGQARVDGDVEAVLTPAQAKEFQSWKPK